MAFIVNMKNERGDPETIGVIRAVSDADNNEAEFAIIVRSDMQRKGIGRKLMEKLVTYCNTRGTRRLACRESKASDTYAQAWTMAMEDFP